MNSTKKVLEWLQGPNGYGPEIAAECEKRFREKGIEDRIGTDEAFFVLDEVLNKRQEELCLRGRSPFIGPGSLIACTVDREKPIPA